VLHNSRKYPGNDHAASGERSPGKNPEWSFCWGHPPHGGLSYRLNIKTIYTIKQNEKSITRIIIRPTERRMRVSRVNLRVNTKEILPINRIGIIANGTSTKQ